MSVAAESSSRGVQVKASSLKGGVVSTTSSVVGPKNPRREELFGIAAELFWDKGYHATSMSDVAEAMGIRKASVYHHVRSKETLLYEMSVESMHHMIDAATSAGGSDPVEHLRAIIVRHIGALLDDRDKHATALVELRSLSTEERQHITDLRSRYDRLIDEAVRQVQGTEGMWPTIPTRLVRLGLLGMLNWVVFWYSPAGRETPDEIGDAFAQMLLGAARGRDGSPTP